MKCRGRLHFINGWVAENGAETLREAKQRARYMLSEAYRRSGEMSERLVYAEVRLGVEGECVFDYLRPDFVMPEFNPIDERMETP